MMDEHVVSAILHECVKEADTLKCLLADWSNIGGIDALKTIPFQHICNNEYREAWLTAYDNYHQTIWGTVFFNLLGEKLLAQCISHKQRLHVLDVGCGTSQLFRNMFHKNDDISKEACSYVSIDKCPELNGIITMPNIDFTVSDPIRRRDLRWVAEHCDRSHTMMDVFDTNSHLDAPLNSHNIMIIDIEPHGREWEVYQRFLPYMKQCHILILKCVGFIDLFASNMALDFISKVNESADIDIHDQVAWLWSQDRDFECLNIYPRDVVLVMKKVIDM